VAAAVAARFGVTKGELLAPDAQDMAVRLALGETHVIADTKRALEEAGVDLELLERAAAAGGGAAARGRLARSGTTILVKNLPYEVTREELCEMFERFGGLGTLILPPTKTLALVDFLEVRAPGWGSRITCTRTTHSSLTPPSPSSSSQRQKELERSKFVVPCTGRSWG